MLIGNGTVITRDVSMPFIQDGALMTKDGVIVAIGEISELQAAYPNEQFIDAGGGLIMPGLINTHGHFYSAFARGIALKGAPAKNFTEKLEKMWFKIDSLLTLPDTISSAQWGLLDGIRNGVTTVFDHHASYGGIEGSLRAIAENAAAFGVRSCLCFEVSDRNGQEAMKRAVAENVNFAQLVKNEKRTKAMFGLHASFTCSDKTLQYCCEQKAADTGFHIHTAEDLADVKDSLAKYGKPVVQRLYQQGILSERTIAVHGIHISPREMELLADTKTMLVHNPESNMGNAVGCAPVLQQLALGIKVGLGTDGYTNDMFESLKVANILHKHEQCDPRVAWSEPPEMLFYNNADIAKRVFGEEIGLLKVGAVADIIIAQYNPHTPMNKDNYDGHILFGINGRCVTHTIANGKMLMENQKILIADEQELMAKSRENAQKLWNRL